MNPKTIVFIRQVPNRHGDSIDGASVAIPGCIVAPRPSIERQDGRDTVITGLTVYPPAGAVILPTDVALVDGVRYQVKGDHGEWESPFSGWKPGGEVALELVTG